MTRYSIDTRTLQAGDIFIPVKGEHFDGHDFIDEARRKGAAHILDVELGPFAAEHRRKFNIPVIGVTGSAGKTTVKNMLGAVLAQKFNVQVSEHNQNNEVGVPLTLLKIDAQTQVAVIEMALRHTGDLKLLAEWALPTHALVTQVGHTHLAQFCDRPALARAKAEIFDADPAPQKAFINRQDDFSDLLTAHARLRQAQVIYFDGQDAFAQNRAAVAAVAKDFGLNDTQIEEGLRQVPASPHRLAIETLSGGLTLIDDSYNANPAAMRAASLYARQYLHARPMGAVFGDMLELGDEALRLHQEFMDWFAHEIPCAWLLWVGAFGPQLRFSAHLTTHCASTWQQALPWVQGQLPRCNGVLVKGSRGMALDGLVAALQADKAKTNG